jgi:enoyl-CoA hydratase
MSERVSLEVIGGVGVIQMDDGKVNAMQREFLEAFNAALDRAEAQKVKSLAVIGRAGCFSAGLDLKTLPMLERTELRSVLQLFADTMLRVFNLERPVVAALSGHAIAGGCVLALAADRRIAAEGPFKIGLNEVPLGINLPLMVIELARLALPVDRVTAAVACGEFSEGADRKAHGWVEDLVAPGALRGRAVALATALGRAPAGAFNHAKRLLRGDADRRARAVIAEELDGFAGGFLPK